jgi:putative ABC transport system permease protein
MSFLPVRIGFFLALRQLWRSSWWTSSLIIFVMVLTFLNLVVVSGILVGLIQGAVTQQRIQFTSDIIVSTLDDKQYIENSPNVIRLIETLPEVVALTPRYREGAVLEANYKTRKDTDKPNTANAQVVGINPLNESVVTGIDQYIIEGEFLSPGDFDQIVVGHFLLSQYIPIESPNFQSLDNVGIGTKIRIRFDDVIREVTVKGILRTKVDDVSIAAFMDDAQLRSLIGRNDGNVDEIAIKLTPSADPNVVRDLLLLNGVGEFAKV